MSIRDNYQRYKEELDVLAPYLGWVYLCFSAGVIIIFILTSDNPLLQLLFALISLGLAGLIFINKSQALRDINDYITVSFSLIVIVILFVKRKDANPSVFYAELVALLVILATSIIYRFLVRKTFDMFYRLQYKQDEEAEKVQRMIDKNFPFCIESEQIVVLHIDVGNLFEYYRYALDTEGFDENKLTSVLNEILDFLNTIAYNHKLILEKKGYRYYYFLRKTDKEYKSSFSEQFLKSGLEMLDNLNKLNSKEGTDFGFNIGIVRDDYIISRPAETQICFRFKDEVFLRAEKIRLDGDNKTICVDENIFHEHAGRHYQFSKKTIEITTEQESDKRDVYILKNK